MLLLFRPSPNIRGGYRAPAKKVEPKKPVSRAAPNDRRAKPSSADRNKDRSGREKGRKRVSFIGYRLAGHKLFHFDIKNVVDEINF